MPLDILMTEGIVIRLNGGIDLRARELDSESAKSGRGAFSRGGDQRLIPQRQNPGLAIRIDKVFVKDVDPGIDNPDDDAFSRVGGRPGADDIGMYLWNAGIQMSADARWGVDLFDIVQRGHRLQLVESYIADRDTARVAHDDHSGRAQWVDAAGVANRNAQDLVTSDTRRRVPH